MKARASPSFTSRLSPSSTSPLCGNDLERLSRERIIVFSVMFIIALLSFNQSFAAFGII
jgi:hypothetical protein